MLIGGEQRAKLAPATKMTMQPMVERRTCRLKQRPANKSLASPGACWCNEPEVQRLAPASRPISGGDSSNQAQVGPNRSLPAHLYLSPSRRFAAAATAFRLATASLLLLMAAALTCAGAETQMINLKVGALFEELAHEQANMFIRTIKMINDRRDETIRRLLEASGGDGGVGSRHNYYQVSSAAGSPMATGGGSKPNTNNSHVHVRLEPMIEFLRDPQSSFEADCKVCQLIESGVQALLGPMDGPTIQHVQSICDNMELPYFEVRPQLGSPPPPLTLAPVVVASLNESKFKEVPIDTFTTSTPNQAQKAQNKPEELTLNLFPPANLLTSAYIDLIYAWNWTSFAIVYEQGNSLVKLQDLFKESSGTWTSKWQIKLFQFEPSQAATSSGHFAAPTGHHHRRNTSSTPAPNLPSDQLQQQQFSTDSKESLSQQRLGKRKPSFRDLFWSIRKSGELNILLDVSTANLYEALKQAQQVGCMTERYSYLVTSLDLHTIDLEDFRYSRTRITAFSLLQVLKASYATTTTADLTPHGALLLDERYLDKLGVHVLQPPSNGLGESVVKLSAEQLDSGANGNANFHQPQKPKYKLSPSVVLERTGGGYMEPNSESQQFELSRREMLQSSPASMSLLPSVDRDHEHRLFEFFLEQQERNLSHVRLSTSSAILHDSLLLFALGLRELDPTGALLNAREPPGSGNNSPGCSAQSRPWAHGSSMVNYMRQISFRGLTGLVAFDQRGQRSDFRLDMMGMAPDVGLVKVGEWHSSRRFSSPNKQRQNNHEEEEPELRQVEAAGESAADIKLEQPETGSKQAEPKTKEEWNGELENEYERQLARYRRLMSQGVKVSVPYLKPISRSGALMVNEIIYERLYREQADQVDTLIVTTKLSQPYFMLKETPNKLEGNDQYEGFAVDLIHELSKLINFRYKWREAADKKYGSKEILANGSVRWNGMIGEIVRGQADLAIVDLTITAQREEAVDFTLPFMNTGISILFKKPTTKVTTLFSFLSPFSSDVWAYVLAAYCGISAVLYLVGHLSPYEWDNPHPCRHMNDDSDLVVLKNQFSLLNSFWFTIGSLMQQGSDLTPRSMSTRTIAGIWYFFTLIMISSYTANLAAFLTVEKVVYPIENVRDLSNQQEIRYGCVESGSTCTFFHDSQIDTYKRINDNMQRYKTYVRSNDDGQKRVEEGKFAFFMESASIEYIVERNCNLTQIGGLLDSKGYGLATSKKSRLKRPYRMLLSEGILHLQETGMLQVLKNRWWKERRGGGTCTDDGKGGGVTELSLANVGGVFVVLLGGLGVSFLVAIAEFMWRSKRGGSTRDGMCEEMMNDLKFALSCKRSMKPVNKARRERRQQREQQRSSSRRAQFANHHGAHNSSNQQQEHLWSSSLMSQTSTTGLQDDNQQQQQWANSTSGSNNGGRLKDCNPILMHAMLTMLLEQQQQQQQQQQQYLHCATKNGPTNLGPITASSPLPARDNNNNSGNKRPGLVGPGQMQHHLEQQQQARRQRWTKASVGHQQQQPKPNTSSSSDAAFKRRLLFAQQTIDTYNSNSQDYQQQQQQLQ